MTGVTATRLAAVAFRCTAAAAEEVSFSPD
jgi:hypothetical protein